MIGAEDFMRFMDRVEELLTEILETLRELTDRSE